MRVRMASALAAAFVLLAAAEPAAARLLLDATSRRPPPPPTAPLSCAESARVVGNGGRHTSVDPSTGKPCGADTSKRVQLPIFTLIWVAAGGLCLLVLFRVAWLKVMYPHAQAAAPAGGAVATRAATRGASPPAAWKVRYAVRVEQPDGGVVAGMEASLRAGFAYTASAVRRASDSLHVAPGSSVHAAWTDVLLSAPGAAPDGSARAEASSPPAEEAIAATAPLMPDAEWAGWRLAADVAPTPAALAELHIALAIGDAEARAVPSAPQWPGLEPAAAAPAEGAEGTLHAGQAPP